MNSRDLPSLDHHNPAPFGELKLKKLKKPGQRPEQSTLRWLLAFILAVRSILVVCSFSYRSSGIVFYCVRRVKARSDGLHCLTSLASILTVLPFLTATSFW